jgi:hypothetical protein
MKILVESKRTFIPFFNGNRDLPEGEQIVVTYKVPDLALKSRLKPKPKMKFNFANDGRTTGGETEVSIDQMAVVAGMLISIKGAFYENDKGEQKITNATELRACPLEYEPLVEELYNEFTKELDRVVDEKN